MNSLEGLDGGNDDPCAGGERWGLYRETRGGGVLGFCWRGCYLHVREGATQGRGAGGREAHSPPLLLQRPGQLFKLHLLLPDRLQQSRCALTLLHTHYIAPRGESGALHKSIQPQTHYSTGRGSLTDTDTPSHIKATATGCRIFGLMLSRI